MHGRRSVCPYLSRRRTAPGRDAVLQTLNALREHTTQCGDRALGPATPLRWNPRLAHAAQDYAQELANRGMLTHVGMRGDALPERLRRVAYRFSVAGENLAAGHENLMQAAQAWLESPAHCVNVMMPLFTEVGVACVRPQGQLYATVWVAHFGTELDE